MTATTWSDALTGSGDLDGSPVGSASDRVWTAKTGSWSRSSTGATTTASPSTNPFVTTDVLTGDFDAQTGTYTGAGGGDALYFRCSDASNWWRLRNRYVVVTTPGTWYGTGWYTVGGPFADSRPNGTYDVQYSTHGVPTLKTVVSAGLGQQWSQDQAQSPSSTSSYYYLVLDKCTAGTVTQVASRAASSFGTLRVVTSGNVITVYKSDGTTVDTTVTDSFNQTATQVGVGLGGSDSNAYASALTNFSISIDTPITPPTILSPANAADVDIAAATIVVQSNFVASDPPTSIDIFTKQGSGDWVETDDAFMRVEGTAAQWSYTIPEADLTAGTQVEVQVRATDTLGNPTTDWSPSTFFTPRTAPAAPTFVSPSSGATVVVSDIATVDFGTDSTVRQARRVADDGSGNPDTSTVYQASLTITGPDDDGNYTLTGDGSIHPTGAEHIQVRRQTAAGGTLWSDWGDADLPVQMELAAPFTPLMTVAQPVGTATNIFTIICTPADTDHTDAVRVDVYRDGVRVARLDVPDGGVVTWTDDAPGTASDYRFVAVAANGAQASFG